MAKEIQIGINIKGKSIKAVNDDLKYMNESLLKVRTGSKLFYALVESIEQTEKELKDLTTTLKPLEVEFKSLSALMGDAEDKLFALALAGDKSSKEYKELSAEVSKYKKVQNETNLATDKGARTMGQKLNGAISGAAGAFSVATGAMALFGGESEELQAAMQKIVIVQGIVNGLEQVYGMLKGSSTIAVIGSIAATIGSTVAMTAMTSAQWLLNAAMLANPIGLVILAITALVAGIYLLIKAYDALFGEEAQLEAARDDAAKANAERIKEQTEANNKALKEKLDNLKKEREEEKKAFEDNQIETDLKIGRLDALGKATEHLTYIKLKSILTERQSELEYLRDSINDYIEYYKIQAKINGISEKEMLERAGITQNTIDKVNDYLKKAADEVYKAESELIQLTTDAKEEAADKEKEAADKAKEDREKRLSDEQKSVLAAMRADILLAKSEEERVEKQKAYLLKLNEYEVNAAGITAGEIKEINAQLVIDLKAIDDAYITDQESMDNAILQHKNLTAQAEYDFNKKLKDQQEKDEEDRLARIEAARKKAIDDEVKETERLQQKYDDMTTGNSEKRKEDYQKNQEDLRKMLDANIIDEEEYNKKSRALRIGNIANIVGEVLNYVKMGMEILQELDTFMDQKDEERAAQRDTKNKAYEEKLKASLANRKMSQEEYDNQLRILKQQQDVQEKLAAIKSFNRDKRLSLMKAIISTAEGIAKAVAASPFTGGLPGSAIAAAVGGIQIATISKQQFKAASGGIVPGNGPGHIDSVPSLLAPGEAVINSKSTAMFGGLLSQINQIGGGISLTPDVPVSGMSSIVYENNNKQTIQAYVVENNVTQVQKQVQRYKDRSTFKTKIN
jgi:hypothetical protein